MHSVYSYAPKPAKVLDYLCEVHKTVQFNDRLPGQIIPVKDIDGYDFFQVCGIKIDGEILNYNRYRDFNVSRKVLEILLNHKAKGLTQVGVFLNSKFAPVMNCE
jgi:hypothetical protein